MPDVDTTDDDERLDDAAQGMNVTAEDTTDDETAEVDTIGEAAGFVLPDEKPFRGIEQVERRDLHRWELDPESEREAPPPDEEPAPITH